MPINVKFSRLNSESICCAQKSVPTATWGFVWHLKFNIYTLYSWDDEACSNKSHKEIGKVKNKLLCFVDPSTLLQIEISHSRIISQLPFVSLSLSLSLYLSQAKVIAKPRWIEIRNKSYCTLKCGRLQMNSLQFAPIRMITLLWQFCTSLSLSPSSLFFISNKNCQAHDILQLICKQNIFQNVFHRIEKWEKEWAGRSNAITCSRALLQVRFIARCTAIYFLWLLLK